MLTRVINRGFGSFNIINSIKGVKNSLAAPIKHIKSLVEPSGNRHNPQTNTTEEAFDEVSQEWQTFVASNPYDLQTFNYLENAQLMNFGTVDNPLVIFTADAPFRFVNCTGMQNEDDYEGHEPMWLMLREGPLQRCGICGQVFKLVRLRNENSAEMDYYLPNFHPYEYQEMGETDILSLLSVQKMNTHYEYTYHETPEESVYTMANPDEHDRALVDPAYRMHKLTLAEEKARVWEHTMKQLDDENERVLTVREPIAKIDYDNLINAEVVIKKLDRNFRKVLKFESRKFVDPINHSRREKRMQQRAKERWDGAYTLFSGTLTEEEQKYRDYFQTDLENYKEDEVLEEYIDKQALLSKPRYNLNRFDFQEHYVDGAEDDQSSYLEKKIFKFKYRRALDSAENYERRQNRLEQNQKARLSKDNAKELIDNYLKDPAKYENEYFDFVQEESKAMYKDYFESDKDENLDHLIATDPAAFVPIFENYQIPKYDRSAVHTIKYAPWNRELGWWSNVVNTLAEVGQIIPEAQSAIVDHQIKTLSSTSLEVKGDGGIKPAASHHEEAPKQNKAPKQEVKKEAKKHEEPKKEAKKAEEPKKAEKPQEKKPEPKKPEAKKAEEPKKPEAKKAEEPKKTEEKHEDKHDKKSGGFFGAFKKKK